MSRHFSGRILTLILCAALSFALLTQPQKAALGFESGVQLCIHNILPALFPFFVVCELMATFPLQSRALRMVARLLGLQSEQSAAALMLAWAGGYAVCAQQVGRLRRSHTICARDASLILLLGCCSGPGFVIGCVGGLLLGNLRLGLLLYTAQLAANFLCTALCLPFLPQPCSQDSISHLTQSFRPASLPAALSDAVNSSLQVCGCVVFFRIVACLLSSLWPHIPLALPLASAACEISAGCADFALLGGRTALYGCCICMSLLGLSVWMQIYTLLQGTCSLRLLFFSRLLHALIFPLLVGLCTRFLPGSYAVYRTLADRVITTKRLPPDAALITFLFLCTALYKIRQNFYNK